ncbi:MAG TPA: sugar ABC transporter substrate-binding protein [Actinokineospora sp.]|nr:sugar ABC transporter substrate-binding protein [Actinokineospora sp.]
MGKKLFTAAAAFVTAALALGGCSSSSSDTGGSADDGPVTLSYAIWDAKQEATLRKIADEFTKANPNIKVDIQVTPTTNDGYQTKLRTAATAGNAPDVFWLNGPNFQFFASNGQLLPLSDQNAADAAKWPSALKELYSYEGKQYGVPKDFDTVGLWFNKKMFDAAGVKYPDDTWTWQTFTDAAKKLSDPAKGTFGVAALLTGQENYYDTILQAGGSVISADGKKSGFDDPASIEGLKIWTDLIKNGASPSQAAMTDTHPVTMFMSEKIAMYWGGSWNAAEFNKNPAIKDIVDVAVLPQGKQRATVIHGLGNVVYAKTKYPKQATKFANFLGSETAAKIQAETGTVIPAYDGLTETWVKSMPQFNLKAYIDELAYAKPYPISKNAAVWNKMETDILTAAWAGTTPIDEAAKKLAADMNAALAKEK